MHRLVHEDQLMRALRLAQRHVRASAVLAGALDRLEDAEDLRAAYKLLVEVADGELRRRRGVAAVNC